MRQTNRYIKGRNLFLTIFRLNIFVITFAQIYSSGGDKKLICFYCQVSKIVPRFIAAHSLPVA